MKKKIFIGVMIVLVYGLFELASLSGLFLLKKIMGREYRPALSYSLSESHKNTLIHLLKKDTSKSILTYSPTLGWTVKKGGKTKLYQTNSQGIRGDKKFSFIPSNQTIRISAFGDSFTFSEDVNNDDAWAKILTSTYSDLEVLNFGVGGYGLDQAFLRYKQDGIQFNSHIIFIGYMTSNINRNVNIYVPFIRPDTRIPLSKPRFILKNKKLILVKNPMKQLSQYQKILDHPEEILPQMAADDFYPHQFFKKEWRADFLPSIRLFKIVIHSINQKFMPKTGLYIGDAPALKITLRIFDEFVKASLQNNSLPIILIFPRISDIKRYQQGKPRQYNPLITSFKSKGFLFIDLLEVFIEQGKINNLEELFIPHYNPRVNQWVAKYIFNYLKTNEFSKLSGVKTKLSQMKTTAKLEN
jgi:hypothetical protein